MLKQIGHIRVHINAICELCGEKPVAVVLHKKSYHIYCQDCFENLTPDNFSEKSNSNKAIINAVIWSDYDWDND